MKMEQPVIPQLPNPIVILDTNIIGSLLDRNRVGGILNALQALSENHDFLVSQYTHYELLKKGSSDVKALMRFVNNFRYFIIDSSVLFFGAMLSCLGIKDDGDNIIAATALLNKATILTANQRHFPVKYFDEELSWSITFKDQMRTHTEHIYLLKPVVEKILADVNTISYIVAVSNSPAPQQISP
jgi:predicted nucleic acid-binding protein